MLCPPGTSAVMLTIPGGLVAAQVMREAQEKIPLASLEIEESQLRRSLTENFIIEIPSESRDEKAAKLAEAWVG